MERRGSLYFCKSTLLLFSITVSTSVSLCSIFYLWVLGYYSSGAHITTLRFSSFPTIADDGGGCHISCGSAQARESFRETSGSFGEVLGPVPDGEVTNFSMSLRLSEDSGYLARVMDSGSREEDSILEDARPREGSNPLPDAPGSAAGGEGFVSDDTHFRKSTVPSKVDDSDAIAAAPAGNITEKGRWGACDLSRGRWVFDESYPHYSSTSCPFVDEGFSCHANGRVDTDYMKWRWQPEGCSIPRFDAVKMLEMLRGKRLVFVGDSINRNQWESLLCMLTSGVTDPTRVYEAHGRRITKQKGSYIFKFADYHCSVEFYVSHFLVRESNARVGGKRRPTLRIDAIDRSSRRWRGADILVFNSAHWWSHYKTKAGKDYYQEKDRVHKHLDVSTALTSALTTWADWVDRNVNPRRTQVFFRSSSPSHFWGGEWNSGGHCTGSTRPLNDTPIRTPANKNAIVDRIVRKMRTPVTVLNITNLSGHRIDGHPSVFGRRRPDGGPQDCSHWCLPGVPDTWNELLYFHLLSKQRTVDTDRIPVDSSS